MKPYEMLLLVKPGLGDEGVAQARSRVEGWLAENGGKLEETVDVGEAPLAFEIKKHTRGHYFLLWFAGPAALPDALAHRLRVDEDVMRHMVVERHPLSLKTVTRATEEKGDGKRSKPSYSDG